MLLCVSACVGVHVCVRVCECARECLCVCVYVCVCVYLCFACSSVLLMLDINIIYLLYYIFYAYPQNNSWEPCVFIRCNYGHINSNTFRNDIRWICFRNSHIFPPVTPQCCIAILIITVMLVPLSLFLLHFLRCHYMMNVV